MRNTAAAAGCYARAAVRLLALQTSSAGALLGQTSAAVLPTLRVFPDFYERRDALSGDDNYLFVSRDNLEVCPQYTRT